MALWLKADAEAYNDAGSTLATNGQTVQQWNDQSGNANNATQGTSGERATFITGALNGLPVVRFINGKSYALPTTLGAVGRGTGTFFFVGLYSDQGAFDSGNWLTGHTSGGAILNYQLPLGWQANDPIILCGVNSSPGQAPDTYFQSNATCDGLIPNHVEHRISQASASGGDSGGTNNIGFNLIANITAEGKLRGDIAEFIFYSRVLDAAEILTVEDYLFTKWGV